MEGNSWLWVAIIAFLVFCCLPMVFMGRHDKQSTHTDTADRRDKSGDLD